MEFSLSKAIKFAQEATHKLTLDKFEISDKQLQTLSDKIRNEVLEEVAVWYDKEGWLLDESYVAEEIRGRKNFNCDDGV